MNIPLKSGVTDSMYLEVFEDVLAKVTEAFSPDAVVVCCGADCLQGCVFTCLSHPQPLSRLFQWESLVSFQFYIVYYVTRILCTMLSYWNSDAIGDFNLSLEGLGKCVTMVKELKLPTLYLGGGGYNPTLTTRCWVYLTSIVMDVELCNDIPEHEFIERFD